MNQSSLTKIATLHPVVQQYALRFATQLEQRGYAVIIAQALRTFTEQNALYAQGRTAPGPVVTNARAGYSWHNWGVAFDIAFLNSNGALTYDVDWNQVGQIGKSIGLEWGGDWASFPDRPHFQITGNLQLSTLIGSSNPTSLINAEINRFSLEGSPLTPPVAPVVTAPQIAPWAERSVKKAIQSGVMKDWSHPQDPVSWATWESIFLQLGVIDHVTGQPMTHERLAVILDRLGLLG